MSITNVSKPTTSLTNNAKVSFGELWSTITTTWATETRTWMESISLFTNTSASASSFLWSFRRFPWQELHPWTIDVGMTNTNKPS